MNLIERILQLLEAPNFNAEYKKFVSQGYHKAGLGKNVDMFFKLELKRKRFFKNCFEKKSETKTLKSVALPTP